MVGETRKTKRLKINFRKTALLFGSVVFLFYLCLMKVKDHKKFCCFEYESDMSNTNFQLGDIVTKESEDGIEIGVVIQLHDDGDFRTDMFGNASPSEVKLSTLEDIELYRNELLDEIELKVFRITYRMEYYIDAINEADARSRFSNLSREELDRNSGYVEFVSIDEE